MNLDEFRSNREVRFTGERSSCLKDGERESLVGFSFIF